MNLSLPQRSSKDLYLEIIDELPSQEFGFVVTSDEVELANFRHEFRVALRGHPLQEKISCFIPDDKSALYIYHNTHKALGEL